MRIAQLISVGVTNGAARHGLAVSAELARRGHAVVLFHRRWLEIDEAQAAGVCCIEWEFELSPPGLRALRGRFADHGVDVAHVHTSKAHAIALALRLLGGPPVVATAHAQHLQLPWALTDLVIAPSAAAASYHRRVNLVPPRRMRVIPSFIGAQRFDPPTADRRRAARERLGVPADALLVGQVADIHFDKRQSDLVAAGAGLQARWPNLRVALKGAPVNALELARIETARGGRGDLLVHVVEREGVGLFLDALDIFAVTSVREVGPLCALEAMSAGLPVVGTQVGRLPELLGDGAAGLLVRPRDRTALAAAIDRLASHPQDAARMGAAARARALCTADETGAFDAIEAVLAEAAALRSRPRRA
jgi:glycosyltransferase involved in cell wall biosynthesis